jgi:S-formylglutathione hydrolase FrmB
MTSRRLSRITVSVVAAVAALASGVLASSYAGVGATTASSRVTFRDSARIHVVSTDRLDDRQYAVRVLSPALGRPVDVRVLLPRGYDPSSSKRYPVLYLFHGTSGRASDWVQAGEAEATTERLPVITVMPDAGFDGNGGSWFTDWVDTTTQLGPSRWETFHIKHVIPWIDANLRTVRSRYGRAVAGLSQGGFGSMTYAARHPDLFCSVASFSGAPEIARDPDVAVGATAVIYATAYGLDGVQPEAMFGSRVTNAVNWNGHDPASLIDNLRATSIHLWTATGANGPYDPAPNPTGTGIEFLTHVSTDRFHQHLVEADVPSSYHDYTYGTHTWAYWARDLQQYVRAMMRDFAHPRRPVSTTYTSIDKRWTQWGWRVAFDRAAAQEFSELSYGNGSGFTLTGSGTAAVRTPRFYRPGEALRVSGIGATRVLHADRAGRLRLSVPLAAGAATVRIVRDLSGGAASGR